MDFLKLKEKALKIGIAEIEIYKAVMDNISISTFNQEVDSNVISNTIGIAVRGVYNNQITTVYTENDSEDAMDDIIKTIVENTALITKDEPYFIFGGSEKYQVLEEATNDYDEYSMDYKVKMCLKLDEIARSKSQYVDKTQASYSQVHYKLSIVNSNGLDVEREYKYAYLYSNIYCKKDEEVKTGHKVEIFKNIKDVNLDKIAQVAIDNAVNSFGATPVDSKKYKVVFENETFGDLITAFTGSFSAENVLKNLSFLKDKVGQKVFGDNISFIDNPLDLRATTQSTFDDEGVATFKKTLVENGVLKTYLHNLKTAKMMNTISTANASKAGITSAVTISPINLSLKCGNKTFEEMLSQVEYGIYINSLQGLHSGVVPLNGDFSLQCSGFEIVDGKLSRPVTLIVVSGNIIDVLNKVVDISDDFTFASDVGTGSALISELSISGK